MSHTLFHPHADYLVFNQEYEYECPATGETVRFTLAGEEWHRVEPARPIGAVLIRPAK
jgi:hypothetical protein